MPTFITASLSGGVSALLLQPMDLVKTRQQAQWKTSTVKRSATPNALSLALSIIREEDSARFGRARRRVRSHLPDVGVYFSSLEGCKVWGDALARLVRFHSEFFRRGCSASSRRDSLTAHHGHQDQDGRATFYHALPRAAWCLAEHASRASIFWIAVHAAARCPLFRALRHVLRESTGRL